MAQIIITLFLALTMLTGCIGQTPSSKRNTDAQEQAASDDPTEVDQESEVYWYTTSKIEGQLTINQDSSSNLFLKGNTIHDFLNTDSNKDYQYCLVINFNDSQTSNAPFIRARALPLSSLNLKNNTREYYLRIELNDQATNTSTCAGTINHYQTLASSPTLKANGAYDLVNLCTNCSGKQSSTKIDLYRVVSSQISTSSLISSNLVGLGGLSFRIDYTNNSSGTGSGSSCSDTDCRAQGLDCCVDGQCVQDATLKLNPNQDDLLEAIAAVNLDFKNYKKWPSVYNVCGTGAPSTGDEDETDPDDEAQARIDEKVGWYNCLEGAKSDPASYSSCLPSGDLTSFQTIRTKFWQECGCAVDEDSNPTDSTCINYGLKLVTATDGTVTNVVCDIPASDSDGTFQELDVTLSTRSTPHRFYAENGTNYDEIDSLQTILPDLKQEGEEFKYFDEINKSGPMPTRFSMNAILGQMSVGLDKALPAKVVTVELNKNYRIAVNKGYYTPCPSCEKDKWWKLFLPHPASDYGNGIDADPVTTNRAVTGYSTHSANYEDNIFGRACFVPPTMLPFSHKAKSDLQTQRLDRLATQAAMYINGYQRDWYGFNKGAVIGSFDGVKWFAVGSLTRRVRSTSKKLFLAINAPFADLAQESSISVRIIEDNGAADVSTKDYDPDLAINDYNQNRAATCQKNHFCNVDSDCVTTLGWEYTCADVSKFKTYWPKYSTTAEEVAGDEYADYTFSSLIFGGTNTTLKRCVYRGAGAPCKVSYQDGLTDAKTQKLFQCAPNFYCSSMNDINFNDELVRSTTNISNIAYGQDADILGRPLNYVGGASNGSLTASIKENLLHNAALFFDKDTSNAQANDFGFCRPGKLLTGSWQNQHKVADNIKRADYINQIGSCDSSLSSTSRVQSCPAFDSDGNYINETATIALRNEQNSCGGETLKSDNTSTFDFIEALNLPSVTSISRPTLVKDACFRRPGSVCHTDLDCSPNRLHKEVASSLSFLDFGNTEAEYNYWQEQLICGQATPKPSWGSEDALNYDLTQNRCCREVGKTITMFTEGTHLNSNVNNQQLNADLYPASSPSSTGRYSRYAVTSAANYSVSGSSSPVYQVPAVTQFQAPKAYQWRTINSTAQKTCCGGGWIRKFSDGTHIWPRKKLMALNMSDLKCINYENPLYKEALPGANTLNYAKDASKLCLHPSENNGCLQIPLTAGTFDVTPPRAINSGLATTLDTSPETQYDKLSSEVFYMPTPYKTPVDMLSNGKMYNYFFDSEFAYGLSIYLPIYIRDVNALRPVDHDADITTSPIESIRAFYYNENGQKIHEEWLLEHTPVGTNCLDDGTSNANQNAAANLPDRTWCMENRDGYTILHANAGAGDLLTGDPYTNAGLVIEFYTYRATAAVTNKPMKAGNDLYYSTKLSRFELAGIPQMFYEPLYCNDNRENLVPGLFNSATTRTDFENGAYGSYDYNGTNGSQNDLHQIHDPTNTTLDDSNTAGLVVDETRITQQPFFSENEFMCCTNLGQEVDNASNCCSGYATSDEDGALTCKLPSKTNLMVYFNRFVSGEGVGDEQPGGGLVDDDFIMETGEPKLRSSTYTKIRALGEEYCDDGLGSSDSSGSKTRNGASFGSFTPEPNTGGFIGSDDDFDPNTVGYYSIVDSADDDDADISTGAGYYLQGYRWGHHIYCK
ncbi:hypothetical protein HBN50_09050 [Halobacteriovorax sp. GB3]|uniref:hypothetical protein n=1 Tax=Halobacteriovorax sp. GB3 TaxID=2719615 RepID=UPI0023603C1C|nr:hypothetical protein [Halobacteriovorax sp. GB3]MDD0853244.1 hypothetical protein [Halobacteriovorax sp. GB3]